MRTRLRSLLAVITVGLLATTAAACSNGEDDNTLDVLVGANAQFPTQQQQWFADTAAEFKQRTGATVHFETFASANDELTKMQTAVISGDGPDVYSLGTTFTPTAYATGAFVKLGDSEWAKLGGRDKFVPSSLGISGPDAANQIGIPGASRPFVMIYNTELLKAAGIEKPATTWDELTAQAEQLTHGDQYGLATAYKDNFDPWKLIWGMSVQDGNPILDGRTATLDDPIVKQAYQTYFGWLTKDHVVNPAAVGWSNSQALAAFAEGKTGYFLFSSSLASLTLDQSAVKGKYDFALMPTVPPGQTQRPANGVDAASILSGDNYVIADYSLNKDLAFEFVKMITDEESQLQQHQLFGVLPVNAAAAQTLADDPKLKITLQALDKSKPTPFNGSWGDVQLALTNVVVQSIPELSAGDVSDSALSARLAEAQQKAQSAAARAR